MKTYAVTIKATVYKTITVEAHNEDEQRLARVMNAWQKSRAALRRLEKRLDIEVMDDPTRYAYQADEAQAAMWDANAAYLNDSI